MWRWVAAITREGKKDIAKIRVIFGYVWYVFRRRTNAAETAGNVNAGFEEDTANERTKRFVFNRFRRPLAKFDLKNEPRGKPATKVNNDTLKMMVEPDSYQSTKEIAA